MRLTKGGNDGASDAVGHTDCKDAHGPSVLQAKLELVGLTLRNVERTREQHLSPADMNPQRRREIGKAASTNPPDVNALGLRLGHAEAEGVDRQRRHAEQLHGRADQAGGDDVVHEEGAVVGEEDAPVAGSGGERCNGKLEKSTFPPTFFSVKNTNPLVTSRRAGTVTDSSPWWVKTL